jgi:uncharacterized beta-barrel protein YwiB (DUF1934 family)
MRREVTLTIEGWQLDSEDSLVRFTTDGIYHLQLGKHYIQYEEVSEEVGGITKNMIKIAQDHVEITKKGAASSQMCFDLKQNTEAIYQTPYGNLSFEVRTSSILYEETEADLWVRMDYALYSENSHLSDHRTEIKIQVKPSTSCLQ